MKSLKILFILCFMLGFVTNAVNAQSAEPSRYTYLRYWWLPCVDEYIYGYYTERIVFNKNTYNGTISGKFIGLETGTDYQFVHHCIHHFIDGPGHYGQNQTLLVHANGKPIAVLKFVIHYTINANGILTEVKNDDWEIECLNR
jgi:hypothetical protein